VPCSLTSTLPVTSHPSCAFCSRLASPGSPSTHTPLLLDPPNYPFPSHSSHLSGLLTPPGLTRAPSRASHKSFIRIVYHHAGRQGPLTMSQCFRASFSPAAAHWDTITPDCHHRYGHAARGPPSNVSGGESPTAGEDAGCRWHRWSSEKAREFLLLAVAGRAGPVEPSALVELWDLSEVSGKILRLPELQKSVW
jgi:hypothetical protein